MGGAASRLLGAVGGGDGDGRAAHRCAQVSEDGSAPRHCRDAAQAAIVLKLAIGQERRVDQGEFDWWGRGGEGGGKGGERATKKKAVEKRADGIGRRSERVEKRVQAEGRHRGRRI